MTMLERAWRSAARAWHRIPLREPWRLLLPLLVVHWVAVGIFTTKVNHNAWLFYQGGDQIWYWTTGWLVGNGETTEPLVSHGWSMILAPFALLGGPGFLGGLPGAMLLQVIFFAPIALWCMYELGEHIGGRIVGYTAALAWTIGPYVAVPLFVQRYHDRYVDQFLPLPFGLTAMSDYAATVCLLVATVFLVRATRGQDHSAALLAGLAAGFAILIKPSNALFLPAALALPLAARRWRELALLGAAIVPALVALTVWKYRGFGYLPALAFGERHVALGSDIVTDPFNRYVGIDWGNIQANLDSLREFFWSVRVLQWLPFAGAVAVARRSVPLAVFLSLWFWVFFLVKGSVDQSTVDSGSFLRFLLPAMPAFVLLAVSLPLLFPKVGGRLATTALPARREARRGVLIAAGVLAGLVPIVVAATISPLKGPEKVLKESGIAVPVDAAVNLSAAIDRGAVRLRWDQPPTRGSRVFYKLFRSPAPTDSICLSHDPGANDCTLKSETALITRAESTVDRPGPGTWTYRVGVAANWVDDPARGDVYVFSPPLTVTTS